MESHINRYKETQTGFTLIELMMVIAIIGILAAIAILFYENYTTRAKISELIVASSACKFSVSEVYQVTGSLPVDLTASGCSSIATKYINNVDVTNGIITITATSTLAGVFSNTSFNTYVLDPTVGNIANLPLNWECSSSTIEARYLPSSCQ